MSRHRIFILKYITHRESEKNTKLKIPLNKLTEKELNKYLKQLKR